MVLKIRIYQLKLYDLQAPLHVLRLYLLMHASRDLTLEYATQIFSPETIRRAPQVVAWTAPTPPSTPPLSESTESAGTSETESCGSEDPSPEDDDDDQDDEGTYSGSSSSVSSSNLAQEE
jgi:hypothetical protein